MKKIITAAMASIMIFTTVAPSIAYAKESLEVSENYQNEEKVDQNLEVNSNENSNETRRRKYRRKSKGRSSKT